MSNETEQPDVVVPEGEMDLEGLVRALAEQRKLVEAANKRADEAEAREKAAAASIANVANVSQASSKARYRIIIEEGNTPSDNGPVFVGVNGRAYQIARSIAVDVPYDVIEVLQNAVIGKSEPRIDPVTKEPNGISVRDVRRFPFRNLGMVIDEEGNQIGKE